MKVILSVALSLLASAACLAAPTFTSVEFAELVKATHQLCPNRPVEHLSPAGLLDMEEGYREWLAGPDRKRLDVVVRLAPDGSVTECAGSPGGATCPAMAYLKGMSGAKLKPSFSSYVCREMRDEDILPKSFW